jgi:hypothetical protein
MECMDATKVVLEFLKVLISWPVVAVIGMLRFQKQIRALVEEIRSLLGRIKKLDVFGVSVEVAEQLLQEAKPSRQKKGAGSDIELSVSSGAYSTDYRAIFVVVGIANRGDRPDQVVSWQLSFPNLNIELEPTLAPHNLVGGVPWWPSPLVKLPPDELVQGSLFFRGRGTLNEGLPDEPLRGKVVAGTLHGKTLSQDVEVYRLATLQARAMDASV